MDTPRNPTVHPKPDPASLQADLERVRAARVEEAKAEIERLRAKLDELQAELEE